MFDGVLYFNCKFKIIVINNNKELKLNELLMNVFNSLSVC